MCWPARSATAPPSTACCWIFDADSESAINARLEDDPWTPMGMLETVSVERWNVLLGDLSGR